MVDLEIEALIEEIFAEIAISGKKSLSSLCPEMGPILPKIRPGAVAEEARQVLTREDI
jgi:hypothetical protein